jgi:hypothetical protein
MPRRDVADLSGFRLPEVGLYRHLFPKHTGLRVDLADTSGYYNADQANPGRLTGQEEVLGKVKMLSCWAGAMATSRGQCILIGYCGREGHEGLGL